MKFLGIDYGTKRIGLALSDESNTFALPLKVLEKSKHIVDELKGIIDEKGVTHVVLGESKDFKGNDNKVMPAIRELKEKIENELGKPVIFELEFLTSHQAEQFQGKTEFLDASAAALILQSYLDRLKQSAN